MNIFIKAKQPSTLNFHYVLNLNYGINSDIILLYYLSHNISYVYDVLTAAMNIFAILINLLIFFSQAFYQQYLKFLNSLNIFVEYLGGNSFYMMSFRPGKSVRPTTGEIYLVDTVLLKKVNTHLEFLSTSVSVFYQILISTLRKFRIIGCPLSYWKQSVEFMIISVSNNKFNNAI